MPIRSYCELSFQNLMYICYMCTDRRCMHEVLVWPWDGNFLPLEHPGYAKGGNKGPWLYLFQSASILGSC